MIAPATLSSGSAFVPVLSPDAQQQWLYVADGSLFPDALGVNPQLTIMAMATHVGRQMAARG